MTTFTRIIVITLLLLSAYHAKANEESRKTFDVQRGLYQLQMINDKIYNKTYTNNEFHNLKEILYTLEIDSRDCVDNNQKNLLQLEKLMIKNDFQEKTVSNKASKKPNAGNNYLENEMIHAQEQLDDCELLLYKVMKTKSKVDVIEQYKTRAFEYIPMPSLWTKPSMTKWLNYPKFDLQTSLTYFGFYYFTDKHKATTLLTVAVTTIIIITLLWQFAKHKLLHRPIGKRLMPAISKFLIWGIFFEINYLFLSHFFQHTYPKPTCQDIVKQLSLFYFARFVLEAVRTISSYKKTRKHQAMIAEASARFSWLLVFSFTVSICAMLVPDSQVNAVNFTPYVIAYLAVLFPLILFCLKSTLMLLCKHGILSSEKAKYTFYFSIALSFAFIFATSFGFGYVTYYIASRVVQTILLVGFIWLFLYFFWVYIYQFLDPNHSLFKVVHQKLGLKPGKKLIELSLLRILLTVAMLRRVINIFFDTWGLPKYHLYLGSEYIQNNIKLLGVSINIIDILRGVATFCAIIIIGRITGAYITQHSKSLNTRSSRITIITLTNYLMFIIALFASLYVAGINITGFTLVASALSVGIGFGLKGLAADMVSGLILLLSKPLSPGDHIVVGSTEGYIQRIRLLSTQIKTIEESNVILPNATLLGKSVINYTYKSKQARMKSQVMLERTQDVAKVKKIMLDVASMHPDVEQAEKVKPEVIVDLRTERNVLQIVLTLWCVIKDVDERFRINSDINAKILKALEKAKIPLKL